MKPRWTGATLLAAAFALALLPMTANATPLPAPAPLSPTAGATVDQPVFSWQPVDGAASYEIEVALDDQFVTVTDPGDEVAPRVVKGTTYVPTYSYTAKTHYWHVRAVSTDGAKGTWSAPREFTRRWTNDDEAAGVEQGTPSSRVEQLHLVGGDFTPALNQIAFAWDPVFGAAYYELQISTQASFNDLSKSATCTTAHPEYALYYAGGYVRRDPIGDPCLALLPLRVGTTYHVRVRAVDVPTAGDYPSADVQQPIFGVWSDQGTKGPLTWTPAANAGSPGVGQAALPTDGSGTQSDLPLLAWEPAADAESYRVAIALDRDFTNVVGLYGSESAYFIPPESYDDNAPGQAYYWYALPCSGIEPLEVCETADRTAINDDAYVGSFRKRSVPLLGTTGASQDQQANVFLTWGDALKAAQGTYSGYTSGGSQAYKVQMTRGSWDRTPDATVTTDNLSYSTAAAEPLDSGTYRWRVRPLDGQGVPLAWAYGPEFTIVKPDGPKPGPSQSATSPNPGTSTSPNPGTSPTLPGVGSEPTGPPPVYQPPAPADGTAAALPPEKPGTPVAKRVSKRKVRVHWRASEELGEPVTEYLVYRSTDGSRFAIAKRTTLHATKVKAARGKPYWFYVVADSDAGRSEPSARVRFSK